MLTQIVNAIAALKQQQLQAQARRAQSEIEEIDRQIQQCSKAIERMKNQQKD
jgi:hypothetical protein